MSSYGALVGGNVGVIGGRDRPRVSADSTAIVVGRVDRVAGWLRLSSSWAATLGLAPRHGGAAGPLPRVGRARTM